MIDIVEQGARIRNAAFWTADAGCIVAGDKEGDDENLAQSLIFIIPARGKPSYRLLDWIAHAICLLPGNKEGALVSSDEGRLLTVTERSVDEGQIAFTDRKSRHIVLRSLKLYNERIYAVGMNGLVARLRDDGLWDAVVEPAPGRSGLEALDGFSDSEIYVAGWKGMLAELQGTSMTLHTTPTTVILTDIVCAGDGHVYVCGQNGVLLRGRRSQWEVICEDATQENLWSVEWFEGRLYIATILALYTVANNTLIPVDFDGDPPTTCYRLTKSKGFLWSIGREDIMRFDGTTWIRVA